MNNETRFSAFTGVTLLVTGGFDEMLRATKAHLDSGGSADLLIFDDSTGEQVDFDFHGNVEEVLRRAARPEKKGRGRPRLGVIGREVSLLPRHWEWLDRQPQSASATIRRLIEAARKQDALGGDARRRIEAAGRFIWAMAGNYENFEESSRALYARDWARLRELTHPWPKDVRNHLFSMLTGLENGGTL